MMISVGYVLLIIDINLYLGNKKCIDTRTFTRPKKRTSRMSFESIFEGLPRCVTNIWKPQNSNNMCTENVSVYQPYHLHS